MAGDGQLFAQVGAAERDKVNGGGFLPAAGVCKGVQLLLHKILDAVEHAAVHRDHIHVVGAFSGHVVAVGAGRLVAQQVIKARAVFKIHLYLGGGVIQSVVLQAAYRTHIFGRDQAEAVFYHIFRRGFIQWKALQPLHRIGGVGGAAGGGAFSRRFGYDYKAAVFIFDLHRLHVLNLLGEQADRGIVGSGGSRLRLLLGQLQSGEGAAEHDERRGRRQ